MNEKTEVVGAWAVAWYGNHVKGRCEIQETIGPGLAKLVKVCDTLAQAQYLVDRHNMDMVAR